MVSEKSKSKRAARPEKRARNKPTLVVFLLDRTGSMQSCQDETIKGFNGYVDELDKKENSAMRLTLTQFDSIAIDIVHDAVPLHRVSRLTKETYQPRASTPLYDAIGKTIRETEAKAKEYKILFVTLTDGLENASSEWNSSTIKNLIKEKEKEGWTFAHIGVGANGWAATTALSVGTISASNVLHINPKDTVKTYERFAGATTSYAASTYNVNVSASNLWDEKKKKPTS